MKGRFNFTKDKLTQEQKIYLSNLFGIGGGATLYTEWQYMFPIIEVKPLSIWQQILIIIVSVTMLFIGLKFQDIENGNTSNGYN